MPETDVDIKDLFEELKTDWKTRTTYMSNSAQIAAVRSYQRIIGMGPAALPLILKELEREPDHWFWALEAISGENPVPPNQAGRVADMAKRWIEWGRQKGLV